MITTKQLKRAREELQKTTSKDVDEKLLIAYEWLDAQQKIDRATSLRTNLQQLISTWGGKSIDVDDIDLAAHLHDEITGKYPNYNINYRFVLPAAERLRGLGSAYEQENALRFLLENYRAYERVKYSVADGDSLKISYLAEKLPPSQYDWLDFCSSHNDCKCYYCVYGS